MKTMLAAATAVAWLALSGAASAAPSTDPDRADAGTYKVEPAHTRVLFSVLHMGFTHYYGDFSGVSGTLAIDPKNVDAAKVQVSIPVASVSTTNAKLDGELKSAGWLDAGAFQTMTFVSSKVTRTGPKTARIEGALTMHGQTHPVTLDATFNAVGPAPFVGTYTMGFDAIGHLKRSDFWREPVPGLPVSDNVDLIISAAFVKG